MIDIENFQLLINKLWEIVKCRPFALGDYGEGSYEINILNDNIEFITYEHWSDQYPESHTLLIPINEINNPIEFFENKFAIELEEKNKKYEEAKKSQLIWKEKEERRQYEALKLKYGNG